MGDPAILKWYLFPPGKPHFLERTKDAALSCGRLRFVALGDDSLGSLRVRGCLVFRETPEDQTTLNLSHPLWHLTPLKGKKDHVSLRSWTCYSLTLTLPAAEEAIAVGTAVAATSECHRIPTPAVRFMEKADSRTCEGECLTHRWSIPVLNHTSRAKTRELHEPLCFRKCIRYIEWYLLWHARTLVVNCLSVLEMWSEGVS